MSPLKTLLSIFGLFVVLGLLAMAYPPQGIKVGNFVLRYPTLSDIFPKEEQVVTIADSTADTTDVVMAPTVDPEEEIKKMMEATRKREFTEFSDSLKFYEDFFREGKTRFYLPNDDPTWFDRFFLSLELAALDTSVVHIVHYGDSQLEEDRITSTIREYLQNEFGGAGPGMLPAVLSTPAITVSYRNSGALERHFMFGTPEDLAPHNRYGVLAQMANLNGTATLSFQKRNERDDHFPHVGGFSTIKVLAGARGRLSAKLTYNKTFVEIVGQNDDGTNKEKIYTKMVDAGEPTVETFNKLKVLTWKLPDTTSSGRLDLSGYTELYGISADGSYGVAVDNVAMRGSSGTVFTRIDSELLAESFKAMNAKLVIMEFGGNMIPSTTSKNVGWIKKVLPPQIKAIQKANPNADILFLGPPDMSTKTDGAWKTHPSVNLVAKTLKEIALDHGLAYWDMYRIMGGNGSMIKWVKQAPALGFTDHIHFTRRGAAYMGELLCEAIRMHYDYFKFRERHNINDEKLKDIHEFSDSLNTISNAIQDSVPADTTAPEVTQ